MKYQVKDPQGQLHVIDGPDGASPDQVIAQAKKLLPKQTDWKGIIGSAVKSSFQKPAAFAKDLGTNPESMANAMPTALGTLGAYSRIPGGATLGTLTGQGLRAGALAALGKKNKIPPLLEVNSQFPFVHGQVPELGLAALGDVAAIPAMKKSYYGAKIGKAEQDANVVARGAPRAVTPGSVGETLNNLEAQIDSGAINSAQGAKDSKEIMDQIYGNESIYEKSPGIAVQSARVSNKVQELLNTMIQGRRAPAEGMSKAMTIPRMIGKGIKAIPRPIRKGMQWGTGLMAGGGTTYEVIKRLMGG